MSGRDGAEEGAGAPKSSPAESGGDSERTAVFRAVTPPAPAATPPAKDSASTGRPGAAGSGAGSAAADSERTAVFRAVKPPVAPAGDAGATGRAAPPKASTFVPLRTDGAPAPAVTPKPAPKPAPTPAYESPERTTQQPLPPKPPLDMLADLTNNPPPPPSPLRTAVRRFKIYAPVVVLLAIVLSAAQLVRPLPEPTLVMTAKSSYTFEGAKPQLPWPSEGQAYMAAAGLGPLGQSGEQKPVPIASVTKSMTAYIILRDHPIKKGEKGAVIDVDKTAESEGRKNNSTDNESTLDTVKEGDKLTEYDAIAALMIPSANNIARLLARWDSGSQEAFVKKMNDTAKDLGMKNTTYTDPSGLDATTVSTAEDQVKLGLKLVEIETLLEITKRPSWQDPSGKVWRNWNGLVPFNESLGIKTGTTTKAGGNLLFAAYKDVGKTRQLVVGAVLGQHKPPIIDSVLAASKQLMTATQKSLNGAPVVQKGDVVGYVDDGLGGRTPVVATADVQAVGWGALTVGIELAQGDGSKIPQTAKAGTEIGVLTVGEGASQVKVPVALKSDLASPGIGSKLTRVG
ncbi:D-alanyl-D-alanine carboxypeptidase family protein [Streptomyces sp. NPDC058618]|uniref:D-alanyl-D-alanine carboxypeptidase family protein n=1 Tax=Streptomyces sp. NPDC058618 TaxID=3346558 RepID=UPI00365420CF